MARSSALEASIGAGRKVMQTRHVKSEALKARLAPAATIGIPHTVIAPL